MPPSLAPLKRPSAACVPDGKRQRSSRSLRPHVDDDILDMYAKTFCAKLKSRSPQFFQQACDAAKKLSPLQHASACSGTGISFLSSNALFKILCDCSVHDAFFCDKTTGKVLKDFVHQHPDSKKSCIFQEIEQLSSDNGKAYCMVHKKECFVPILGKNSLYDCGFSCKLLRRCTNIDAKAMTFCMRWKEVLAKPMKE